MRTRPVLCFVWGESVLALPAPVVLSDVEGSAVEGSHPRAKQPLSPDAACFSITPRVNRNRKKPREKLRFYGGEIHRLESERVLSAGRLRLAPAPGIAQEAPCGAACPTSD